MGNQISAGQLKEAFLAGASLLNEKKELINELNVFPVPDGDTGTNMTMTILSAAREVADIEEPDIENVTKAMAGGSLRGARGNSGVILSQLIRGFTKELRESGVIDAPVLARAFNRAVETAYRAVMKPKEGTILTVAKGVAERMTELAVSGGTDSHSGKGARVRGRGARKDTGAATGFEGSRCRRLRREGAHDGPLRRPSLPEGGKDGA